jgi:hypothetical protein
LKRLDTLFDAGYLPKRMLMSGVVAGVLTKS